MSKKLSEEEKQRRRDKRDEKAIQKEAHPKVDKHGAKILRILREEAAEHPGIKYNSEYFEKRLDVSNITILRAIQKLKLNHLIKPKQEHGSYVLDEKFTEELYSQHFADEIKRNIALIASLGGLLQQYKKTPLYENVVDLIYLLQPDIARKDDIFSSGRVVVSPQMEYDIKTENWDKVYEALNSNHKIKFRYTKSYTNKEVQRTVWPLQLILENGSVYLWSYSEYAKCNLMYDLNFMTEVVVLRDTFKLPKDFDINNYSGGGRLGAFAGNSVEKFKIRFTGYAKEWIKNHKWADDQTYKEDKNSTTITFTSSQYEKVFLTVLSWGSQTEPLAPARLVKRWKDEIKAMAKMAEGGKK